jgi:hypothetical protein
MTIITTAQFHAAIARHIDETKPDPLAKRQLESISLSWRGDEDEDEEVTLALRNRRTSLVNGVLTLSSEYISIFIRVVCECRVSTVKTKAKTTTDDKIDPNEEGGTNDRSEETVRVMPLKHQSNDVLKSFDDEFYFQLTVHAKLKSKTLNTAIADDEGYDDDINLTTKKTKEQKRKMEHKLHLAMTNRLQSDVSVRRLLLLPDINRYNNSNTVNSNSKSNVDEGITLCEALIQRNRTTQLELEERVNVDEGVLDGIRTAIYSHAEDNLDILELLLNMPYLPRSSGGGGALILPQSNDAKGRGGEHEGEDINDIPPSASSSSTTSDEADTIMIIINELAQRAYLRLLEDAMFDACEKEGEDELLDDLTIT